MSMVTSGILFAINTTGGAKAKMQFAAVAAAVLVIGKHLNDVRKSAEEFDQTFKRLTVTQRDAVRAMEAATKGLIDTKVEMDSVVKVTEAGMKATPKLMSAIGRLASDMADKLGEGPKGATTRVKKLTDAISKGQTRALKEYGIDLENTEDLLLAQDEAMEKVIKRAQGLTVELDTLTKQTFALNNNWETFLGLVLGSVGTSGPLGLFNELLSESNDIMMVSQDSAEGVALAMHTMGLRIKATYFEFLGFNDMADSFVDRIENIKRVLEFQKNQVIRREEFAVEVAAGGQTSEWDDWDQGVSVQAPEIVKAETKKKKTTGGGGRRRMAEDTMVFTEADAAAAEMEYLLGEAIKDTNKAFYDRQDIYEEEAQTLEEKWEAEREWDEAARAKAIEKQEWESQFKEVEWQRNLETKEAEQALEIEHHNWLLAHSEEYAKKQAEIDKAAAMARLGQFKGMFTNLSSLMQLENKKAFMIGKMASYSATVINTAEAAMASFKAMAGIPYVGPALGAAAAATAVIAGGVQLATIKRQKYGDSGGGVSAGPVGSTGGGYLGGGGNYAAGGVGGSQPLQVTVILGEEEFHGWSIKANEKASQKGDPHFADGMAA